MTGTAPAAEAVEVKAIVGRQRGVAVVHHGDGALGLHMYWPEQDAAQANDHHPVHGLMQRTVAYLTVEERKALAGELLRGL